MADVVSVVIRIAW